ncbi:unnamed protein product, partial [Polarella glacialis]
GTETDLLFAPSPEAVAERLRLISFSHIEGSRLPIHYNTSTAIFSHLGETETDLPLAQSSEADAEHRRLISSLNIEPSVFCYAFNAPPGFEDLAPPAVKALQTLAVEEPRSLPLAPPGARFLTTWPSVRPSTIAEEVKPQIMTNNKYKWSLEESRVQRPSRRHKRGECKPCAWFTTNRGCKRGMSCTFCHLCQSKTESLRQRRQWAVATLFSPATSDY